jgi:hypothetical protein
LAGIHEILSNELKIGHKQNEFIEKINLLQRKINLKVTNPQFYSDKILFSLSSASNIIFEFTIVECEVKKNILLNGKVIPFNEVDIEYSNTLNSPVIKSVSIISEDDFLSIYLYPWALHGQLATYELSAGLAFKLHSNIRLKNLNNFQKSDPSLEPIPAFFFRYGPLFLSKDGLGSLVFNKGDLSVVAMGIIEGEPYETYGLDRRSQGFFLGSILKYNLFELIYYNDFFKDKGYNLKINLVPVIYSSMDWKLSPQVFAQYWNSDYVNYYFGVKPNESVRSSMNSYRTHHAINYGALMEGIHYVANWSFVLDLGIKNFSKVVYLSPTVVKKSEIQFITAVVYKFF